MVDTAVGDASASTPAQDAGLLERALFEVKRVIVGQDRMVERMVVCLLAKGHCLLEGVPGVAKTLAVETLATVSGGTFAAYPRVAARVVEDDVADAMSGVHWCPVGTASAGTFRLQKDPVRCRWGQVASRQPPEMEKQ